MEISILSNINLTPIDAFVKKQGFSNVLFADFGQYHMELVNPISDLHKHPPAYVWIHLDADILLKNELNTLPISENNENLLGDFCNDLSIYANKHLRTQIIVSSIELQNDEFINYLELNSDYSFKNLEDKINQKLVELAKKAPNIYMLNFGKLVRKYGYNSLTDSKFWYLGRIKYTNVCYQALTNELVNLVNAINGKSKKVLVLDLDNTLWGGIIGEDGIDKINLSEDGVGKIYRDFQQKIKALKQLGILLAICSKNNTNDANTGFSHPMMVLNQADFIISKINWQNKAQNIKEIADELSLGLNSFVFIDDNPRERSIVRETYSEVEVPEFPSEIAELNNWFNTVVSKNFGKVFLSAEDMKKSEQYQRKAAREEVKSNLSFEEFIKNLQINLTIETNPAMHTKRLAQMCQKTNQFNLTTKRYKESDIESFIEKENYLVFSLDYEDKFGKEGVVGESIIEILNSNAVIDTFLLSCRVIGRNIEYDFLRYIAKSIKNKYKSVKTLTGIYEPTQKNALCEQLYPMAGFNVSNSENQFVIDINKLI